SYTLVLLLDVVMLCKTSEELLELVPRDFDLHDIEAAIQKQPSVMMVHDLHVWTTDGVEALATAHLVVAEHDYQILDQAQATLREFGIEHSTIQLEPEDHIQHEDFCD